MHGRDIDRPRAFLALGRLALHLEDDREHERALTILKLEHQISAELGRGELVERRLHDRDRAVWRERKVKEALEQVRRERRVIAEERDEAVVLERRHGRTLARRW